MRKMGPRGDVLERGVETGLAYSRNITRGGRRWGGWFTHISGNNLERLARLSSTEFELAASKASWHDMPCHVGWNWACFWI